MAEEAKKGISVPKQKWVLRAISRANAWIYRLTGGLIGGEVDGTPVCLVDMIGRKSGRKITIPVMYNPHGENVILVASLGGSEKNPAWYYNLTANPKITIQTGWSRRKMHARQVSPEEKAALWPSIVANFSSYGVYQKGTSRDIPVIMCSPV